MEGSLEGIMEIASPYADMQEFMNKNYKIYTHILNSLALNFLTLQKKLFDVIET